MNTTALDPNIWIVPFTQPEAADPVTGIALVGGKGANLARLAQAGFPVPPGFLVTTRAYRDFVAANGLEAQIQAALPASAEDTAQLEAASEQIRAWFTAGKMPEALASGLLAAYHQMGNRPVAVRSSATAEDLPEMSFAGQQDTYLNILGDEALLKAVAACWGSLWTARAIGYRLRNRVPQSGAALAVVVQTMVESQTSGVLFTANPLTGLRSETVIDATFGLGEALVSGKVEPDHYVVDAARQQITDKTLGAKGLSIHGQTGGGTAEVTQDRRDQQALPDAQILSLAQLGQRVAELYHAPQDIEWAWADQSLYLLQSRAVTSLFPTPEGAAPEPLKIFFSFGAIQGLLDPLTPLGRDTLRFIFASGAGMFGIRVNPETQTVLYTSGERLWINMTTLMRNSVGRKLFYGAIDMMEPTIKQALVQVWDDPHLQPERQGIRFKALRQIAGFGLPLLANMLLSVISPRARREMIVGAGERVLLEMRARVVALSGDPRARLLGLLQLQENYGLKDLPRMLVLFVSCVGAGMASFNALRALAKTTPEGNDHSQAGGGDWPDLVLEMTRGLPHNPTTEMDLALWAVAQAVRRDPAAYQEFQVHPPAELSRRYLTGAMTTSARQVVDPFIEKYGGRGLGEIDLGRTRWFEDPTHIFEVIASYLQMSEASQAPDVVFARGADAAQQAVDRLVNALRRTRGGWFKARLARLWAGRVRELMGVRESPKFFAVRLFSVIRRELLEIGQELVQTGDLAQADDLCYLTYAELNAFGAGDPRDWRGLVAQRREVYRREQLRRQVPRLLLSDGRAFYEGIRAANGDGHGLTGSPVSPGLVEGRVRVVLNPSQAHLLPGEILVCPGTDPSWTPLFLSAGGLVMEVGGMMTHGAVVAREYGIPAVVGVDQATRRLTTGQRIRVNGSTGQVDLLDD